MSTPAEFAAPTATFGYYRGSPIYNGDGSGQGPEVQGIGEFPQGEGEPIAIAIDWTRITIVSALALVVIAEVICLVRMG